MVSWSTLWNVVRTSTTFKWSVGRRSAPWALGRQSRMWPIHLHGAPWTLGQESRMWAERRQSLGGQSVDIVHSGQ